ncbi:MAG: 50S ribosome-binding GTPase [Actinobacteria bacterium]|nr:50S ribosome-binding GTPase [Actinomycetota bacterium]
MNLDGILGALAEAAAQGRVLGLDAATDRAEAVLESAERRQGFLGQTYVLALLGGTGVGKSSLLNTLAGEPVSPTSVIRPTTDRPLAWVASSRRDEIEPLLEWLGVREVRTHADTGLESVAILDMPDFDSVAVEHRRTVDRLLPKLDAVLWVLDPEKYDDERLHSYLRELGTRTGRLRFALNKVDRLQPAEEDAVVDDLVRRLTDDGIASAIIYPVSAATGAGTSALRESLEAEADAKELVMAKLANDALASLDRIAEEAGVAHGYRPLIESEERQEHVARSVEAALDIVDPSGVGRQLRTSLLSKASIRAGSIFSRLVWLIRFLTGHRRRHADPLRYLLTWRNRGAVGRVVNPMRKALLDAIRALPPPARAAIGAGSGGEGLESDIEEALDRAADRSAETISDRPSWVWSSLAVFQAIATGGFIFAIAWYVTLLLGPGDLAVGTIDVPYLGPVPLPLALLTLSLLASLVVAGLARLHASWRGAREARRLRARIRETVTDAVERAGFERLDQVEEARRSLARLREEAAAR